MQKRVNEKTERLVLTPSSAPKKLKSTYSGRYWQNDQWLYQKPYKPEFDPRTTSEVKAKRKDAGFSELKDRLYGGERDNIVGNDVSKEVRQRYWDRNIEQPTEDGITKLPFENPKAYNKLAGWAPRDVKAGPEV